MDTVHPHCAGLDVHKDTVVACVRHHDGGKRARQEVRTFATHTRALEELADWLAAEGVTHAAVESTGVYWKPVFNLLDGRVSPLVPCVSWRAAVAPRLTAAVPRFQVFVRTGYRHLQCLLKPRILLNSLGDWCVSQS